MTTSDESDSLVALGLGSNLGDREAALCQGIELLSCHLSSTRVSSPYLTAPLYHLHQPAYLNAVMVADSSLQPDDLLAVAKAIEWMAGRRRGSRFSARPLDIDLLLFAERQSHRAELRLPHPGLERREFVLAPLAELVPHLSIPPSGTSVAALLAAVAGTQGVERRSWSLRCRKLIP